MRKKPVIHRLGAVLMAVLFVFVPLTGKPQDPKNGNQPKGQDKKDQGKAAKSILFDHDGCAPDRKTECRVAYPLDLDDGEAFVVRIQQTLKSDFDYNIAGIVLFNG